MYTEITLKKNQDRRLRAGYLWIFSNEISNFPNDIAPGEIVKVVSADNRFIGIGFFNPNSLISIRLLSKHEENIDKLFFLKKLSNARKFRETIYPDLDSYRILYGESDFLPGVIIDKYNNNLSIKIFAKGIYKLLSYLLEAINDSIGSENIYLSIDEDIAKLENMDPVAEWVKGSDPGSIEIIENNMKFLVDIEKGQKTGFFFDQRDNRLKLKEYSSDKNILDCFCYTGSFSISAAAAGARKVTGIDSSGPAIKIAKKNAEINGISCSEFIHDDVFSYLKTAKGFDLIIIDPPALIKSRRSYKRGLKKYIELNTLAMNALNKGGILLSSSCSYHLDFDSFLKVLSESSKKSKKRVQITEFGFQSKDHPVLPSMPETKYLKSAFCKIH